MADPETCKAIDDQLKNLRSMISDLGYKVDSDKTKTAAALGAGVFLLLLGAGAAYDLATRKGGIWLMLGAPRETVVWITIGLVAGAAILLASGLRRVRRSDAAVQARLEQMELEYAELLERRNASAESRSA